MVVWLFKGLERFLWCPGRDLMWSPNHASFFPSLLEVDPTHFRSIGADFPSSLTQKMNRQRDSDRSFHVKH